MALALTCLLLGLFLHLSPEHFPVNDFLEYWAAARLELSGGDPYSPAAMGELERENGLGRKKPLMMWNPPWALPLVAPLAFLDLATARMLGLMFTFASLAICGDWLWSFYGGPQQRRLIATALVFLFAPTLLELASGQMSILVLVGITCFLALQQRRAWLPAGASLLLVACKPHLVVVIWLALSTWILAGRRWRLFWGAVLAFGVALGIAVAINPQSLVHYWVGWRSHTMLALYAPPLGGLLRVWLGWRRYWLQFVPTLIGILWWAKWQRARGVDWRRDISILLLVSLCASPYGWPFDQIVLLPALVQRGAELTRAGRSKGRTWALVAFLASNALMAALASRYSVMSLAFAWAAPWWLSLYLVTGPKSGEGEAVRLEATATPSTA